MIPTPTLPPDDSLPIVFSTNRDHNDEIYNDEIYNDEIYRMNGDGSQPTRLTDNDALDSHPRWAPDGQHIAFNSQRDGNWEIYVMDADGSNTTRLTNYADDDFSPTWSPDGRRIAFSSYRGQYDTDVRSERSIL